MANICEDCGAVLDEGDTCADIFNALLILDFTAPGFGDVHFLTVACYMIQHNRYSDEGLTWIRPKLRAFLEEGKSQAEIREIAGQDAGNEIREWKVTRKPGARPLPKVRWSMTIVDVAVQYEDAESYQALVKQWGRSVLDEMQPLLP